MTFSFSTVAAVCFAGAVLLAIFLGIFTSKWSRLKVSDVLDQRCGFCSKSRRDAKRLIAGPQVFICDECVRACVKILEEDAEPPFEPSPAKS